MRRLDLTENIFNEYKQGIEQNSEYYLLSSKFNQEFYDSLNPKQRLQFESIINCVNYDRKFHDRDVIKFVLDYFYRMLL